MIFKLKNFELKGSKIIYSFRVFSEFYKKCHFKNISSLTTVDIPNQPNSISGKDLVKKFKNLPNVKCQPNILEAIKSINLKEGDILLITGSLYLAGEVLSLN